MCPKASNSQSLRAKRGHLRLARIGEIWNHFWFEPISRFRLDLFRRALSISLLLYIGHNWQFRFEWLTAYGFHPSRELLKLAHSPLPLPLLTPGAIPWFGLLYFGSILLVIIGWRVHVTLWIVLLCTVYVTYVDPLSAFALNYIFINAFFILALAYNAPALKEGKKMHAAWPVRTLQIVLLLLYFGSGLSKIFYGEWFVYPDLLWIYVNGIYRTSLAAWALDNLPIVIWPTLQYATLAFEVFAPLLFSLKRLRRYGFAIGFLFQLTIALLMSGLIFFSFQVVTFYILFFEEKSERQEE